MSRVTKAWALLIVLSAASTAFAASGLGGAALVLPVLLRDYLGLAVAPAWLRGFDLGLAFLMLTFAGLALAA